MAGRPENEQESQAKGTVPTSPPSCGDVRLPAQDGSLPGPGTVYNRTGPEGEVGTCPHGRAQAAAGRAKMGCFGAWGPNSAAPAYTAPGMLLSASGPWWHGHNGRP